MGHPDGRWVDRTLYIAPVGAPVGPVAHLHTPKQAFEKRQCVVFGPFSCSAFLCLALWDLKKIDFRSFSTELLANVVSH